MDIVMLNREDLNDAIRSAARLGAEIALRNAPRERPEQYKKSDAAKAIGVSRPTLDRLLAAQKIRLNACGRISAADVERLIEARS